MKKNYFLFLVTMLFAFSIANVSAQHIVVNQVIVGSGGVFGDTTNFVELAAFKPNTGITTTFGSIKTQSIQDVAISGNFAYVAAQDSIAKFNINTYEKVAVTSAVGVNKLLVVGNVLFASFQYPATENYVRVFSTANLSLVANVSDVSDQSAGLLVVGNLVYAAVPGGYASTIGKIAIIDITDYSLVNEINFNEKGVGINDLFYYDGQIMSVNRTPWGDSSSYILVTNMLGTHIEFHRINKIIGNMVGEKDGMLYVVMNSGVGIIDLSDFTIVNSVFIQAPSLTIAGVAMDTINSNFYIATTDYFSTGVGTIYNSDGSEIGNFNAGISADAIAIDYRDNTGINDAFAQNSFKIYPNPAVNVIDVEAVNGQVFDNIKVVDVSGRVLIDKALSLSSGNTSVNISTLKSGLYFLILSNGSEFTSGTFIKK